MNKNIKTLFKGVIPPLLLKSMQAIRRNYISTQKIQPMWESIRTGPASGLSILVNPKMQIYTEMIEGTYDAFFWETLDLARYTNGTLLDIGGHIGYHSLCFARLAGDAGKVHVFEPNRFNNERLRKNVNANETVSKRIVVHDCALGNEKAMIDLVMTDDIDGQTSSGSHLAGIDKPSSDEVYRELNFFKEKVKVAELDELVATENLTDIRLIKLDVEGAEGFVLKGALRTLETHRPDMLIEVHSVVAMLDTATILNSLNYKIDVLEKTRASRCFIFASMKDSQ